MMLLTKCDKPDESCDVCLSFGVKARLILNGVRAIGLNTTVNLCKECLSSLVYESNKAYWSKG